MNVSAVKEKCASRLFASVVIVCGHYGAGKTNFALNLAHDAAACGVRVTLIDLDVVNPYFRSSDYARDLELSGVEVISPVFASRTTSLDVPSLTGAIAPAIERAYAAHAALCDRAQGRSGASACETLACDEVSACEVGSCDDAAVHVASACDETSACEAPAYMVIIDAGGDDAGATALGRFASVIASAPYEMLYVVNERRNLTQTAREACEVLREIEQVSGLRATAVVNNTHLQAETDASVIEEGVAFAKQVARALALPLACTTVPKCAWGEFFGRQDVSLCQKMAPGSLYPVRVYVRTPWDMLDEG